jgi:hypothetical protein
MYINVLQEDQENYGINMNPMDRKEKCYMGYTVGGGRALQYNSP